MGVAHGHHDRDVTEQLLHGAHGRAAHHQVTRERVTEDVPGDLAQPCPFAGLADLQHPTTELAEHERPTEVAVLLQRCPHLFTQRDLARLA